ncbi:hypothetical protein O3P69_013835 [Scylla paramamosain]|uniref:Uncharacterized protein n=1 Tax=Scylla paramamosain TaxID=85552 RepID=A0AAW0SQX5_SCYPA
MNVRISGVEERDHLTSCQECSDASPETGKSPRERVKVAGAWPGGRDKGLPSLSSPLPDYLHALSPSTLSLNLNMCVVWQGCGVACWVVVWLDGIDGAQCPSPSLHCSSRDPPPPHPGASCSKLKSKHSIESICVASEKNCEEYILKSPDLLNAGSECGVSVREGTSIAWPGEDDENDEKLKEEEEEDDSEDDEENKEEEEDDSEEDEKNEEDGEEEDEEENKEEEEIQGDNEDKENKNEEEEEK